jgi:hypothetical protein
MITYISVSLTIVSEYDLLSCAPVHKHKDVPSWKRTRIEVEDQEIFPQVGAPPEVKGVVRR